MERTKHPGIYKRGSRYVVTWRDRGKQHRESFRTLTEAREAKGKRQAGERRAYSNRRFDDYAERWLAGYTGRTSQGLAPSTREGYERNIKDRAIPYFRGIRLKDLEAQDIRAYVKHLRDSGIKPPTIRKALIPLKVMLAMAAEDGHIASNPCQGIRLDLGTADDHKPRAMTRAELAVVLAAVPAEWESFFRFLAHTGLRISETLGLDWQDVELGTDRPHITVRQQCYQGQVRTLKTRYSRRELPLSPGMVATLLAVRAKRYGGPTAPVWATRHGRRLDDHNLRRRVLKPTVEALGLGWVGFHTFRHTCASLLFEGGKDVKQVQEWLGHADPGFTLRTYVHLMDEGLGDAAFLDVVVRGTVSYAESP